MQTKIEIPFFSMYDRDKNSLIGYDRFEEKRLSDLKGYFENETLRNELEKAENSLVYSVYRKNVPEISGELLHCITVIEPGNIGGECYMTRGHYHKNETCAEIYYGQKGRGMLLLQEGENVREIEMNPDTIAYIPAGWGHRTINIGDEPFVFFSIWPANSGYDYQKSKDEPFKKRFYKTKG